MSRPLTGWRRATAADATLVAEITDLAYTKWIDIIGRKPTPMTVDYTQAVINHHIELLDVDGTINALIEMVDMSDHLLIENVAVLPDSQNRGYGKMLLAKAEEIAASRGHTSLLLYTNKAFDVNIRFYLRSGYIIIREEPFRGGFAVHMEKKLPPK